MAQMKHKPAQEMELVEELLTYRNDPLGFVTFVYPWGEEGTPLAHVKEPRPWQIETLEAIGDHTKDQEFALENAMDLAVYQEAIASGRGIGKSALFGMLSNWQTSTHIGSSVITTANTEGQLRGKTFPEFGVWYTMAINSHWWDVETMKVVPQSWIANLVSEQLKIGTGYWGSFGVSWSQENPDSFAGIHNSYGLSVFFDEASGIPEDIWSVTAGFFTERTAYRHWIAFSQGRRNDGAFYNRFHKSSFMKHWKTRQIDARAVTGADQSVYQNIIDTYGEDSDTAKVEVYGGFPDSGEDQFITVSSVEAARSRELPQHADLSENLIMGVDPAPRGRTAIRFRAGRDARTIPPVILKGADNIRISREVMNLAKEYEVDAVVIDAGMGTGVIDYLKLVKFQWQTPLYTVSFGSSVVDDKEWATRGTELWALMRDWLDTGGGIIDSCEYLKRDCISRRWVWHGREDNRKILESKKDLAKRGIDSPDDADALALTFHPKLRAKDPRVIAQQQKNRIAAGVDNPYDF